VTILFTITRPALKFTPVFYLVGKKYYFLEEKQPELESGHSSVSISEIKARDKILGSFHIFTVRHLIKHMEVPATFLHHHSY
jgi:hypothetical protein